MIRRLWLGITWPSAIITLIFGTWIGFLYGSLPTWLLAKLGFVAGLYAYHLSLHFLYKEQQAGVFRFTSDQLRLWNEVATVFLVAIVMLVSVKQLMSIGWGLCGLAILVILLVTAIRIYRFTRKKHDIKS